jgi:hypothetical protein
MATQFVGGDKPLVQGDGAGGFRPEVLLVGTTAGGAVVPVQVDAAGVVQMNQSALQVGTDEPSLGANSSVTNAWTAAKVQSAASANNTNVKSTPGRVGGWALTNNNASARYVHFYDKATAPVAGTDTPKFTIMLPGSGGNNRADDIGTAFTTGIGYSITTGASDTDSAAVGANEVCGVIQYR